MKVAVEGCCHGELAAIYRSLHLLDQQSGVKTDVLVCCGDFEAVRDERDFQCLTTPEKYRHMGDFAPYWRGERIAPVLTIFIGGNHESVNHLRDLYYGGWVCPNIYFLGYSGVINVRKGDEILRIGGISGIHKPNDYRQPYWEKPPFADRSSKISAYHTREYEIMKLSQLALSRSSDQALDIVLTHDWPGGVEHFGALEDMLQKKDRTGQLRGEIERGEFGNPHTLALLQALKPTFHFSAHMHIKYAALIPHQDASVTRFLALDKCLPGRDYMQVCVRFCVVAGDKCDEAC